MNLEQLQHAVFNLIRQPLTADERMRPLTPSGEPTDKIARTLVKPNDRLTSAERLEIYNRAYWFRLLSVLAEDFPGLCAVIGQKKFDAVLQAYLSDCPSASFTLRNLGSRLEDWLRRHPQFVRSNFPLALDMVRLEWAEIEAFDAPEFPRLSLCDLQAFGDSTVFTLQPFLRLVQLNYPVDNLLLKIRDQLEPANDVASNSVQDRKIQAKALRQHMPGRERIFLAVHRQEGTVFFKRLEPEAFRLLDRLQQGDSLSQALEVSFGRAVQSPGIYQQRVASLVFKLGFPGMVLQRGAKMRQFMKLIDKVYGWSVKAANSAQPVLLLAVRLYWGWQFWQAGYGKLSDMGKVVDYFTSLGIPAPSLNAYFIALLEAGGGILLILGLGSRMISLLLAADMLVAFVVADREALTSIFSDPDKFYAAAPYTFLCAAVLVLIFGPGLFSLDTLITRYRKRREPEWQRMPAEDIIQGQAR